MSAETLDTLRGTAAASDSVSDWQALWQAVAGTGLILPLTEQAGEQARPVVIKYADVHTVRAFADISAYAETLDVPGDYAEMDGAQLAAMLAPQNVALLIEVADGGPVFVPAEALEWISLIFRADVDRADSAGMHISAPELPSPELVAAMGQTIGALGSDCPEAWLVKMNEPEAPAELVLVLGLADGLRHIEADIAETVTRAIQASADKPVAVACADRGSPLMNAARRCGIGIGG